VPARRTPGRDAVRRAGLAIGVAGLLLVLLIGRAAPTSASEPLRIRYAVWVGYGPLFLAQQKGFFEAEGVEVQLVRMEDPGEGFEAMAAGRLDGLVSTIDTVAAHAKAGREFQCVLALDDSAGGDGIVARREIRSVRELKGKRVAVRRGSVSQFFLDVLLREAGLSEQDLRIVNMNHGEAGAAFVAGKVDAAVTWEPWLSKGRAAPHGHLLVDSSQTPGLITDVMVFRRDVIEGRPREIRGVVAAWNRAVALWEKSPAEANPIMARAVGDWLRDPVLFADVLTGVRFYDQAANARFFGAPDRPGPIQAVIRDALDLVARPGAARSIAPDDLVTHAFVR
jgi:NitT/TauT family transport system substrate-binding protein